MPKFYFHIRRGDEVTRDLEGSDLASGEQARQEAILAAREILAQRVLKGDPIGEDLFEVTDEHDMVVDEVRFRLVLNL